MEGTIERAEGLIKSGKNEDALAALSGFLEGDPDNVRALMDLGVASHKLNRHGEAEGAFRRILELEPAHREAAKSLCLSLLAEGRKEECLEAAESALKGCPEDHASHAFAASMYQAAGRPTDARLAVDRAIELAGIANFDEYQDLRAAISGLPRPSKVKYRPEVALLCVSGMDNFIHELVKGLSPYCAIKAHVASQPAELLKAVPGAGVVWLEWGNQMTQAILAQKDRLRGKQVIVRIHNYEVHDNLVDRLDFSAATDIVFVCPYLRDLFLQKNLKVPDGCRIHVVHNGIDIRRFRYVPRGDSRKHIAFLAYISYKKDPMVLMHAFAFLAKRHPEAVLHIAGMFQDKRFEIGMPHFLKESGLSDRAVFYGHITNADEWLTDKDYVFSSSLLESQGVGILEAMSRGCRPLIYNFPGAKDLYLRSQLWTTFDDLEDRFANGQDPKDASDFTAKFYDRNREIASWLRIIHGRETVFEDFDFVAYQDAQ
ncbi:MAG: glycosyltransferase [Deltaproteobacteria bacterium]|jgi:glycosyltransferase involved in cell wall biosynthesis|nr:glycosyltransferase [Deltaproteobacteria bacterium]